MTDEDVLFGRIPFDEAIRFFEEKTLVSTKRWNDLWQAQHDVAFMVAGVAKGDLLQGLRDAVLKGVSEGTTRETFRKDFDALVIKHGWPWADRPDTAAYRAWRTDVIYQTNLSAAYAAGRYEQMTDPAVTAARPYWRYRHSGAANPREQHKAWNGLVLRHDDPFWQTHYPPNGWGCGCHVVTLAERDLERLGKTGPDPSPAVVTQPWTDAKTGLTYDVPEGISPGFGYAPGRLKAGLPAARALADRMLRFDWDIASAVWDETERHAVTYLTADFAEWAMRVGAKGYRPAGDVRVVGALSKTWCEALHHEGMEIPSAAVVVRDDDLIHLARSNKPHALSPAQVQQLPRLFSHGTALVRMTNPHGGIGYGLVVKLPGQDRVRLVLMLDRTIKVQRIKHASNYIRTASVMPISTLKDTNQFTLLEGEI